MHYPFHCIVQILKYKHNKIINLFVFEVKQWTQKRQRKLQESKQLDTLKRKGNYMLSLDYIFNKTLPSMCTTDKNDKLCFTSVHEEIEIELEFSLSYQWGSYFPLVLYMVDIKKIIMYLLPFTKTIGGTPHCDIMDNKLISKINYNWVANSHRLEAMSTYP